MLLAHELAHVVQQRRAGVVDAVEALPADALTGDSGGRWTEHAAALTAAQAALGMSAPVTGSAPAGIAREDKKDERSWREKLLDAAKAKLRDRAMEAMGVVEGVAIEGGQIVDTLAWAESKTVDAVDIGSRLRGQEGGTRREHARHDQVVQRPELQARPG